MNLNTYHIEFCIQFVLGMEYPYIVGRICNNFKKNRAFYDKSMKLVYMSS